MLYEFAGGLSANECLSRIKRHLDCEAPDRASVFRWKKKFIDVRGAQCNGRPSILTGEQDVASVKVLI